MIILLIILFIIIVLFEVPGLVRKKYWRELIVYSFFMLLAFALSLLLAIGVNIPSPSIAIKYLVKDLLHLNYK